GASATVPVKSNQAKPPSRILEISSPRVGSAKVKTYERLELHHYVQYDCVANLPATAPIHESRSRLGCLLKARRSAGRWWSSDKADWKSVVVTWSGRRLYPLHWMKR